MLDETSSLSRRLANTDITSSELFKQYDCDGRITVYPINKKATRYLQNMLRIIYSIKLPSALTLGGANDRGIMTTGSRDLLQWVVGGSRAA